MSFHIVDTRITWILESKRPKTGQILVIPANDHLWMGSGPGLELKKELGKEFELEAVRLGPVAPGDVVATSGAPVGFQLLMHAAVMGQDLKWVEGSGRKAVAGILALATKKKMTEILSYPLYRGTHGDRMEPVREMLGAYMEILEEGSSVKTVSILAADDEERALLQDIFLQLLRGETG